MTTISHRVYKGQRNAIQIQLLSDDEPLTDPEDIDHVEICVGGVEIESDSPHVEYDSGEGVVTMRLGLINEIQALPNRVYRVGITAYEVGQIAGLAFSGLVITLRDWCED
jgi:hypothetical protein